MFVNMADEMTHVHNCFFRALNSLYLQAPHITPSDAPSFLNYAAVWSRCLHIHHDGEEKGFFPAVERISGEKGLMDINVSQHHTFHDGIDRFDAYVADCLAGRDKYDGAKFVGIIDGFGAALATHLTEEIKTLLDLERFGSDKMQPLVKVFEEEGGNSMKQIGFMTGFPFLAVNLDKHFEGDRWAATFPPGPGQAVLAVVRNSTYWWHSDWWKFGATDRFGKLRPLYAVGDGKTTDKRFAPAPVAQDLRA